MIRFFSYTGPIQLFTLFLLVVIIKTVMFFLFDEEPYFLLYHQLIGEKLQFGLLYRDVISDEEPLSALVYYLLDFFWGRNSMPHFVLNGILIYVNAILLSYTVKNSNIFNYKGEMVSFIYIILMLYSYDFNYISNGQMASFFVILSINIFLKFIKEENDISGFFKTGFYLGIAFLFYKYIYLYIPLFFVLALIFSRSKLKLYIMFLIGFCFPTVSGMVLYYILDGFIPFGYYFIHSFEVYLDFYNNISWFLLWFAPVILFFVVAVIVVFGSKGFVISQVIFQQILLLFAIYTSILILFFSQRDLLFILLPFVSAFVGSFFNITSKPNLAAFFLYFMLFYAVGNFFAFSLRFEYPGFFDQYILKNTYPQFDNKNILLLGDDISVYKNNRMATLYTHASLAQKNILNFSYFEDIAFFYNKFMPNKPNVIIDEWKLMPRVFESIPEIKTMYTTKDGLIYYLNASTQR